MVPMSIKYEAIYFVGDFDCKQNDKGEDRRRKNHIRNDIKAIAL